MDRCGPIVNNMVH